MESYNEFLTRLGLNPELANCGLGHDPEKVSCHYARMIIRDTDSRTDVIIGHEPRNAHTDGCDIWNTNRPRNCGARS